MILVIPVVAASSNNIGDKQVKTNVRPKMIQSQELLPKEKIQKVSQTSLQQRITKRDIMVQKKRLEKMIKIRKMKFKRDPFSKNTYG
jgi:hypothetical protein